MNIYTRPNKPDYKPVLKRRRFDDFSFDETKPMIRVDAATECHVTPDEVADRMIDYLEISTANMILEPSAGTGQLIKAIDRSGHNLMYVKFIERHHLLFNVCSQIVPDSIGRRDHQGCFLEYAENNQDQTFPRIVMNPPFREIKKHMNAALSLLERRVENDPAILVALVPSTYQHEEAETLEHLDDKTFATTKVNTKIIRFVR